MKLERVKFRESTCLKWAIGVAIALTAYTLYGLVLQWIEGRPAGDGTPLGLVHFLAFWLLGLLWISYRQWTRVVINDDELAEIIANLNPDAFIVVNPNRVITMCSPAVSKMFGFTTTELLGQTTDILYFDRRSSDARATPIHDQLDRLGFHVGVATGKHRNGSAIPLEIITGAIRGKRGAVLLLRDVARRVEAERAVREKDELVRQLEENVNRLRTTEEARDNILHMLIHDMKNPLQVILGTLQLLKDELRIGNAGTVDSYVDETLTHTHRLIDMVNSLLDVSRLEAGVMPLRTGVCDLRVSAKRALASLSRITAGHTVRVYAPADPVPATCDAEIIHRVLVNLISNACFHTQEDSTISVTVSPRDNGARIEIADNGPGIPREYCERIFDKFAHIESPRHTSPGHLSTGLGLKFCKLAVEAHGGQIGVISETGRGATFWLTLPLHAGARLDAEPAPHVENKAAAP